MGEDGTRGANHLLRSLSPVDFAWLSPHLETGDFVRGEVLERADEPVAEVMFLDSGVVSLIASGPAGREIEAGLVGREGMTGLAVVIGDGRASDECRVQVDGSARWIAAGRLSEILAARAGLRQSLLRYAQALLVQISHTALANGRASVEERLARLLLMTHDRLRADAMPLTHDRLSAMLGVRRPGVTDAIHRLEGDGLIRARRSLIEVRDRERLEGAAGGYYGEPERAYDRLVASRPASSRQTPMLEGRVGI